MSPAHASFECPIQSLPHASQIIALGASYFVSVCSLDITTNVGTIDDLRSTARILLVIPVAVLDAVFILWVFTSLSKTLNQLNARRAVAKLELYRWELGKHAGGFKPLFS